VTVGDPVFALRADTTGLDVDADIDPHDHGRDNLSPRRPEISATPTEYDPGNFEWSVDSVPGESDGDVLSFATSTTAVPRYDAIEL